MFHLKLAPSEQIDLLNALHLWGTSVHTRLEPDDPERGAHITASNLVYHNLDSGEISLGEYDSKAFNEALNVWEVSLEARNPELTSPEKIAYRTLAWFFERGIYSE